MACYALPFLISSLYLSITYMMNLTPAPFTEALFLGLCMFGLSANYSSTLYAAYIISPGHLAPTFLVVLNMIKICFVACTPFLADSFQPGRSSSKFMLILFLVMSFGCWVSSWYFIQIQELKKKKNKKR
jgi:hypothetical protein